MPFTFFRYHRRRSRLKSLSRGKPNGSARSRRPSRKGRWSSIKLLMIQNGTLSRKSFRRSKSSWPRAAPRKSSNGLWPREGRENFSPMLSDSEAEHRHRSTRPKRWSQSAPPLFCRKSLILLNGSMANIIITTARISTPLSMRPFLCDCWHTTQSS